LYAYNIKYSAAAGQEIGAKALQGLELKSSDAILTAGSTVTIISTTPHQTLTYEGTVVQNGAYIGAAFYDATTKKLVLLTNNIGLTKSSPVTIDYAANPIPGSEANYNLNANNGQGGATASCFLAGTAVATPAGEVAVETLRPGDLVTTTDGRAVPVSWLGVQTVALRFADKLRVLPIRVRAGALGEALPQRDLLLSADHALCIDGVLIQAGALVNGVSIVRETNVPPVFTYYHVEVADHALIYAEGVPAETFVDNVDRLAFDNWAEHEALNGAAVAIAEMDLPRAKAARQVPESIRARLSARAAALFGTEVAAAA
jgi:hypothetical protein